MLRITAIDNDALTAMIKLEGKLLEPWVEEVRRVCAELFAKQRRLHLDLAAVTFVDAAGIRLIHDLLQGDMVLGACSPFVAALLESKRS